MLYVLCALLVLPLVVHGLLILYVCHYPVQICTAELCILLYILNYLIIELKRIQSGFLCPVSFIDRAVRVCSV